MCDFIDIGNSRLEFILKIFLGSGEQVDARDNVQPRVFGPLRLLLRQRPIGESMSTLPRVLLGIVVKNFVDE
jgi:hypothetical protein